MNIFGKWLKRSGSPSTETTEIPATSESDASGITKLGQGRKILVVDDNEVVLKTFQLKLKSLGFEVVTAVDASAAVSCARQIKPDLMVLDINFPPEVGSTGLQWDGFNIMEWMRRFREVADIPIIIITSGDPDKYKARALAAGATAFFQKPINHEEFLMAIRRVLGQGAAPQAQAV